MHQEEGLNVTTAAQMMSSKVDGFCVFVVGSECFYADYVERFKLRSPCRLSSYLAILELSGSVWSIEKTKGFAFGL